MICLDQFAPGDLLFPVHTGRVLHWKCARRAFANQRETELVMRGQRSHDDPEFTPVPYYYCIETRISLKPREVESLGLEPWPAADEGYDSDSDRDLYYWEGAVEHGEAPEEEFHTLASSPNIDINALVDTAPPIVWSS